MKPVVGLVYLSIILSSLLFGQTKPYISPRGIVNAASFAPLGAPNGLIARGSIFTIFGANLGPAAGVQVSSFPLPTTLAGVSVLISQGKTSVEAFPVFVNANQVNVILPSNTPLGNVTVQVTAGGVKSNIATMKTTGYAPGVFSVLGSGYGPGVIQNFVAQGNTPVNSLQTTATPGQLVILWATGLGPIEGPDNTAPPIGSLPLDLKIMVGGQPATNVPYGGRAPNYAALDQIVFAVPNNAPLGCFVPVQVIVNGALSNVVTMAIQAGGAPCSEAGNPVAAALIKGGNNANVGLVRRTLDYTDDNTGPATNTVDSLSGSFRAEPGNDPFLFHRFISLPPAGTCTAYTARGNLADPSAFLPTAGTNLDAGNVTLSGTSGTKQTATKSGNFDIPLNGSPALDPGTFSLTGAGGVDVGGFSRNTTLGATPVWSNRAALQTSSINRAQGLPITWTGAGNVLIIGSSFDQPTNSSGLFLCRAASGATSITVPPEILGMLPASRVNTALTPGYLFFVATPSDAPASLLTTPISGLNFASLSYSRVTGQVASYQ